MDARSKEPPQSYRSGIKRPWEDDTKIPVQRHGSSNSWHSGTLPPIDAGPFPRHPISGDLEHRAIQNNQYIRNGGNSVVKRVRYEGNDYNELPRADLDKLEKMPPYQAHCKCLNSLERNAMFYH